MDFPIAKRPTFWGVKQSTSFIGDILETVANSSRCLGSGSWTRIPWTSLFWFRLSIIWLSWSWVVSEDSLWSFVFIPIFSHALCLFFTYVADAGSSPMRTVDKHGTKPSDLRWVNARDRISLTSFDTSIPSILWPVIDYTRITLLFNLSI